MTFFLCYNTYMKYTVIDNYAYIEIDSVSYTTIQEFMDALIPSKKYQHLLIQNKWILIDEKSVQRNTKIEGNILKIILYPESYNYTIKSDYDIEILYEDELFVIVNKPAGLLVHSDGNQKITMADHLESYFARKKRLGSVHPIHRLDEDTQGVLVFSKSVIFQSLLDKLLSEKKISRKYLAFVSGKMDVGKTISINASIGKDRHNAKKQRISKDGKEARTKVKCLYSQKDYSIVRCTLDTGRTHQIRVHMAHIGHPLLNDKLYGVKSRRCTSMGLVADKIRIYHPLKEKFIEVSGKISEDLYALMKYKVREEQL